MAHEIRCDCLIIIRKRSQKYRDRTAKVRALARIRSIRMNYRAYRREDAAAIATIFTRSVVEVACQDYSAAQINAWALCALSPEQVHAQCTDGRTVMVAVDHVEKPIAYGDLEADGHIDHLYCSPEVVGMGVASALYDELETIACARGFDRIYTEASEAARRLLSRKGFVVTAERDFEIDGVPIHNYAMEKVLTKAL